MEQAWPIIWKSLVIFVVLLVLTRLLGKKLLGQMTFFDFIVGITIGTISADYVVLTEKGLSVLLGPVVLTAASLAVGFLTLKSLPARKLLEGEPVVVIQNGKIMERNMFKLRYNLDQLEMQLRELGVFDLNEVEFAILEPQGQLSVLKKSQNMPLTPKDMHINTAYHGAASEIIKDGNVLEQNLRQNNLSFDWLYQELKKHRVDKIADVFYASLNTDGSLYIDLNQDRLKYVQKVED